jgi:homoserine kinase
MFPEAPQLLNRLVAAGALASCWSGAGPTLLGICDGGDGERVRTAAEAALDDVGVPGRALVLRPDIEGLIVEDAPYRPDARRAPTDSR